MQFLLIFFFFIVKALFNVSILRETLCATFYVLFWPYHVVEAEHIIQTKKYACFSFFSSFLWVKGEGL